MFKRKKIEEDNLIMFYRQLAAMTAIGMSVSDAIKVLAMEEDTTPLGRLISSMNADISGGKSPGEILPSHLKHLIGVPSGVIDNGGKNISAFFDRLAEHAERIEALKKDSKTVMIYPAAILSILVVVGMFLLVFVVPTFKLMFEGAGSALPLPTQILLGISDIISSYWFIIIAGILAAYVFLWKNLPLRYRIFDMLPLIGTVHRKFAAAEFMSNLAIMSDMKMPAGEACMAASSTVNNIYIAGKFKAMSAGASDYTGLIAEMDKVGIFPPVAVKTLRVGARSDVLDTALSRMTDYCEKDAVRSSERLSALLLPIFMGLTGCIVGFFVISMYLPIFKLASIAGG